MKMGENSHLSQMLSDWSITKLWFWIQTVFIYLL